MIQSTHEGIPRKLCVGCHKVKELTLFEKDSAEFPGKYGRKYTCKSCSIGKSKYRAIDGGPMGRRMERIT